MSDLPIASRSLTAIIVGNPGSFSRSANRKPGLASIGDVARFTARHCCHRELRHQKPAISVERFLVVVVSHKRASIVVVLRKRAWTDLQQRFLRMDSQFLWLRCDSTAIDEQ
ncbi:hypothetical protein TIFTF001_056376 [Ficus carica]|uniref:Uncharacterized protein n=2 Tax=Ficus carica TaxID=3494 RepID=A0AA88JIM1_FICCA|nr:hypothetical protein TIFTF001_056376 [Ficus carica]